jgi:putative membrane protein
MTSLATSTTGSAVASLLGLAALAVGYGVPYWRRARTLAQEGRPVPRWRQICFACGMATLLVALSPPMDRLSDELLLGHMAQHLLIGDIAALLIVLGLTGPLLAPLLRLRGLGGLRALAHPVVALALWAVDLYVWHLPALYQGALRHPPLHVLEHVMFLSFGILMWMALLGPLPKPRWFGALGKLGYVVAVRLTSTVLANILFWSGTVFYPYYASGTRRWNISQLSDQSAAGSIMMVEGSFLTIGLFAWLFLRSAREGEERQELLDAAAAKQVPLTERRAERAVTAGRAKTLRERLERS